MSESQARAGNGSGARAAIGLEDVAIDPNGALADFLQIDRGAEGTADQALNLAAAAVEFSLRDVTRLSRSGGIREHGIFGCEPTAGDALLSHPARDALFDHRATDDARLTHRDEDGAAGVRGDAEFERDRADLIGRAAIGTIHGRKVDAGKKGARAN